MPHFARSASTTQPRVAEVLRKYSGTSESPGETYLRYNSNDEKHTGNGRAAGRADGVAATSDGPFR